MKRLYGFKPLIRIAMLLVLATLCGRTWSMTRFFTADQMSSNLITSLAQDHQGYIWVGTEYGLNRFDGVRFVHYYADDLTPRPLLDNKVKQLFTDSRGTVWVMMSNGLQRYCPESNDFETVTFTEKEVPILTCMQELPDGELWVFNAKRGYWRIDRQTMTARAVSEVNKAIGPVESARFVVDRRQRLWLSAAGRGVLCHDLRTRRNRWFGEQELGAGDVTGVILDRQGRLCAANRSAVVRYNERTQTMERLADVPQGVSVRRVYLNRAGELLVGSFNQGMFRVDLAHKTLQPAYTSPETSQNAYAFLEDALGNVWVGSSRSGLLMVSARPAPFSYQPLSAIDSHNGGLLTCLFCDGAGQRYAAWEGSGLVELGNGGKVQQRWLDGKTVVACLDDGHGHLWLGTYANGACRVDASGGEQWIETLKGQRVKSITTDRQGNLYMAVFGDNLRSFTPDGRERTILKGQRLNNRYLTSLLRDRQGRIWVGHYYGFDLYDPQTDRLVALTVDSVLRRSTVFALQQSADGTVWLGTNHGLYGYNSQTNSWQHIGKAEGLANENICAIVEDAQGYLWVSTYRGLSRLDKQRRVVNFYKGNGLVQTAYLAGVASRSRDGVISFGNDVGFTSFSPSRLQTSTFTHGVRLTGLVLGDEWLSVGDGAIRLSYEDNTFTLQFSTMDFRDVESIVYEYRFADEPEGKWHRTQPGQSDITLTHLTHGHHTLLVRALDNGVASAPCEVSLHITPPWWLSWWAYTLYIICAVGVAVILWLNWRHKQLADMNESRIRFFVDISHELRSPLTLIKSPLTTLLRQKHDPTTQRALDSMLRNTDRLLALTNQILSIRKIEKGQLRLHYAETDLRQLVLRACQSYDYQMQRRHITFSFVCDEPQLMVWLDRNHFDKVVHNLLTNALKYVTDGGEVSVGLRTVSDDHAKGSLRHAAVLTVSDTGSGIDEEQLRHVFERFYQASARPQGGQMGYGIGLNLTKQLVALHHGTIEAHNRHDVDHGSTFTVRIPLGHDHLSKEQLVDADYFETPQSESIATQDASTKEGQQPQDAQASNTTEAQSSRKASDHRSITKLNVQSSTSKRRRTHYSVAVVDDDPEIRRYLSTELGESYHVACYEDGQKALEAITTDVPDLVISDVMMPVMDGVELLHRLKNHTATSHVPVILLTTKTDLRDRIAGLEQGADAYVDKPFDLEELEAEAATLIANRLRMKGKFSGMQEQKDTVRQIELKGNDEQLMERVMRVVNDRLSDSDFNVDALSAEVGLSRVQLHRRMKELTGLSVGEFIRNLRLQQAAKLLAQGDISVSQVTYAVGLSNPSHFATAFKKYFGVSPTDYAAKHKEGKREEGSVKCEA